MIKLFIIIVHVFDEFECFYRIVAQYLRDRKHLGTRRSVTLFEFLRAFAAIRCARMNTYTHICKF